LNSYLWQNQIQRLHNQLVPDNNEQLELNLDQTKCLNYYGLAFLLRFFYTFLLTTIYVLQWVFFNRILLFYKEALRKNLRNSWWSIQFFILKTLLYNRHLKCVQAFLT
jgi:hypothetical protein